jgi:ATP-dependent RNA helicase HelY
LNYIEGDGKIYTLTDKGKILKNFYCEQVLVLMECIQRSIFTELNPIEFVSVLSCFISVSRGSQLHTLNRERVVGGKNSRLSKALSELLKVYKEVEIEEVRAKIRTKSDEVELNFAMVKPVFDFASNASLETIITSGAKTISLGDFVRCAKGIIDILLQMTRYCDGDLKVLAQKSIALLDHGVVALFIEEN